MACLWIAAISYLIEKIRIDLNVAFRDQHHGNFALYIGRRMNKIKGVWPHRTVPSDCADIASAVREIIPSVNHMQTASMICLNLKLRHWMKVSIKVCLNLLDFKAARRDCGT